jgi:prolyl oligopeptidase
MILPLRTSIEPRRLNYPDTLRGEHVDVYHGVSVPDPYRWLEDLDSEATRGWVADQKRLTTEYLQALPEREEVRRRLTELWSFPRWAAPFRQGGRYFFVRHDGLRNQSVLYTQEQLEDEPRVLLDANQLSADGTVALASFNVSDDGRYVAYGLTNGGSDWQEWLVRDVETGEDLPDLLRWVKFSQSAWTHDGAGFFYCRYDEPAAGRPLEEANFWQKLYYHRLGTDQSEDVLVHDCPDDREMGFIPYVSDDGRYLVIHAWKGRDDENAILYQDLQEPDGPVRDLLSAFDACYNFVGNDGPVFWFHTDAGAPRSRLIAVDARDPAPSNWRELIPQAVETLQGVSCVGDFFVALYLKDASSLVRVFDRQGRLQREPELPGLGTVSGFLGTQRSPETFYVFCSHTTPGTVYYYDAETGESHLFSEPFCDGEPFDPASFETRQVFYESLDGTRVPMFLTHKKGLRLDGSNPTYLYGYGGFNTPMTPTFSVPNLVWMERGGVYAVANLRGGGEYGEEWHLAGTRRNKQNTFDDFIAAAEWLVASGYTSHERLAIGGHSNGGLLAAATLIQRPDLVGAALVGVGVLDMLRFHRFTIGWGWVSDYGSPEDAEDFAVLYAYSPYHNARAGEYPAVLITTADHDDRVVPAHSFKFAAALQHAQTGPSPVLIRIETRAGHGTGKPVSKQIEEAADELSFLWSWLAQVR